MTHPTHRRIAVIGGGLAGITAALRCADAGLAVELFEGRRRLGGLTYSFRRGDLSVDNGQHVFLRCCTAYRALLDRLGVADRTALQPRLSIPVHQPDDPIGSVLHRSSLPAPLHLAASILRYRPLTLPQRLGFARAGLALRRVDPADPAADRRSFGEWLRAHGQADRAIDALWDLVGVATLNARANSASLALAAMVFRTALLEDASAADIGWSAVPLSELHGEPALAALTSAGVRVRTCAPVRALEPAGNRWRLVTDDGDHGATTEFDAAVLAVPPTSAEALLPVDSAPVDSPLSEPGWARRLGTTPIINVHVVLDRRVTELPFLAGVGSEVQWVFDRTRSSGLAARSAGQYLALSQSAADSLVDLPVARLRARLLPALAELLPAVRTAEVLDFFVTRERTATFRQAPGSAGLRPGARTRAPGLFLAGAWTATGWPATMEGAVRSGVTAASALLDQEPPAWDSPWPVSRCDAVVGSREGVVA
jgi:squalene-associated FAD-dependent desaturase